MYHTEKHGGRTRYVCDARGCRYATMRPHRLEAHLRQQHQAKTPVAEESPPDEVTVFMLRDEAGQYVTEIADDAFATGDVADGLTFETEDEAREAAEALEGVEVVTVTVGTTPDLSEFLAGNVGDVKERVAKMGDVPSLRLLREEEAQKAKPRKGVLDAIDARIAEIEGQGN